MITTPKCKINISSTEADLYTTEKMHDSDAATVAGRYAGRCRW